jgi:hypothetical protein
MHTNRVATIRREDTTASRVQSRAVACRFPGIKFDGNGIGREASGVFSKRFPPLVGTSASVLYPVNNVV